MIGVKVGEYFVNINYESVQIRQQQKSQRQIRQKIKRQRQKSQDF